MTLKVFQWDERYAKKHLEILLRDAKDYRRYFETQWRKNEGTIYHQDGLLSHDPVDTAGLSIEDISSFLNLEESEGIGVNYTFKNYRFIHAQMSANPPTVVVKPASTDNDDRQKADAADRLVRHAIRRYKMQENIDQATARTLLYGTGWMKTLWNEEGGGMLDIDEATGDLQMEGDILIEPCSTWDIYIDPFAKQWKDMKYIIERKWMSREECRMRYPKFHRKIESKSENNVRREAQLSYRGRHRLENQPVSIYCYWEKGMPINGMGGRYIEFLDDGTLVSPIERNPFTFREVEEDEHTRPTAQLPFHILTDIDVSDQIYGKSFIEYDVEIQDVVNRLDTGTVENLENHSAFRMVLPEGCEIMEDSITNESDVILKVTGSQGPHFVSPPQSPPDMSRLRDRLTAGIDSMAGVNESMFGEQSRETSGFSMQYATNQGNMIRRRLFNKYVSFVEDIYKSYLNLIKAHWEIPRTISVLGKEKAFESVEISSADIVSGFDIVVEYGASLSLDPSSRREEIMQLMPLFEKYGMDGKTIMRMLKLNELEGLYDINDMSRERQIEVFEEMIDGNGDVYVAPEEMQDHDARLAYCYEFVESAQYRDLAERTQRLLKHHIREREALKAAGLGVPSDQEANAGNNPPGPGGDAGATPEVAPAQPTGAPPMMVE